MRAIAVIFLSGTALVGLAASPVRAQQTSSIEQTVRRAAAGMSEAQTLLLQVPDLVEQNLKLKKENDDLQAKLKAMHPAPAQDGGQK